MADDFLKNDGQKFLDLMEQLAQRKVRTTPPEDRGYTSPISDGDGWDDYDDDVSDSDDYDEEDEVCLGEFIIGSFNRPTTYGRRSTHVPNLCRQNV